jgi:hypothetical protein
METHRSCARPDSNDDFVRSHECDDYLCRAEEFYEVLEAFDVQAKAAGLYCLTEGPWQEECGYRLVVCSTPDGVEIASVLQRKFDWYVVVNPCVTKASGTDFFASHLGALGLRYALQWVDIFARLYLKAIAV